MPTEVNYAALSEELKTGKGFSSYSAIVEWLKEEHGQDIEYVRHKSGMSVQSRNFYKHSLIILQFLTRKSKSRWRV